MRLTMQYSMFSFLIAAVLLPCSAAQEVAPIPRKVHIPPDLAETLLVHKEQLVCQKDLDGVKIKGTLVIAVTIGKNGTVIHAHTISGPKILRPLALATVRKYVYKPYRLNNGPVDVSTEVSISIDCFFHTGQA